MSTLKKPNRRGRQKKQLLDEQDLRKQEQMQQKNEQNKNKLNDLNDNLFDTAKLDKNYFLRQHNKNDEHQNEILNVDEEGQIRKQTFLQQKKQDQQQQNIKRVTQTQKKRRRKPGKKQNIFEQDQQNHEQQSKYEDTAQNSTGQKLLQSQPPGSKTKQPSKVELKPDAQIKKQLFESKQQVKDNKSEQQKISNADEQSEEENKGQNSGGQEREEEDEFSKAIEEKQLETQDDEKIFHLHKEIIKFDKQERKSFYYQPLPPKHVSYGFFKRYSNGLSQNYQFAGEDHRPLLFCQNQRGCIGCNYYISMTKQMDKNKPSYLGKLRGNAAGSTYFLYDDGIQPKNEINRSDWRVTMAAIQYQNNFMGMNGPRKLKVTIPSPKLIQDIDTFKLSQQQSLLNFKAPIVAQLRNKTPKWNQKLKSYALNFGGRVKLASIKNFILIGNQFDVEDQDQADHVIIFGKVDQNTFSVQYRHPLSMFQAFGIVMSQFDFKISCQ